MLLDLLQNTPQDVSTGIAGLAMALLAAIGAAATQVTKKVVAPLNAASPVVKSVIALLWGFGVAWVAGKVPSLAAALPSSPEGLGNAANGIVLWLAMMGVHRLGQLAGVPGVGSPTT